jgi:hypothetical protein
MDWDESDELDRAASDAVRAMAEDARRRAKYPEELAALGGNFYEVKGVSFCDTPSETWELYPGVGYLPVPTG